MGSSLVALLYLPLLAWLAVGILLLVAYRRSDSAVVFRLAAVFLAIWALFATTGLLWVLTNGGWVGVVHLAHAPLLLFEPRYLGMWAAGAIGAFGVFFVAFVLSQAVGRGFLALLRPRPLAWPSALPRPATPTSLLTFLSDQPEAFAFTLLERGGPRFLRRHDFILVSKRLLDALTTEERNAVVAHEVGHIRELDGRYLTFFRTLSRTMRWDPILAYLADRLTEREEYRADLDAVELTRQPQALARALYKVARFPSVPRAAPGLLGVGGRRGRRQAAERIRRLMRLAESGQYEEGPGA
jgi:Zn-dependent protease with chaperone function